MFIFVAYQLPASATLLYYHVLQILSTTFFNFFRLVFALSKKALKTCCFLLIVVAVFSNLGYYTPWNQQKSTTFFDFFTKWRFYQNIQFFCVFLCTLYIFIVLSKIPHRYYSFSHHRHH